MFRLAALVLCAAQAAAFAAPAAFAPAVLPARPALQVPAHPQRRKRPRNFFLTSLRRAGVRHTHTATRAVQGGAAAAGSMQLLACARRSDPNRQCCAVRAFPHRRASFFWVRPDARPCMTLLAQGGMQLRQQRGVALSMTEKPQGLRAACKKLVTSAALSLCL